MEGGKMNDYQIDLGERGIYDKRNKLNNLTGKEWLQLQKSVWLSEKSALDKDAFKHPAPFLVEDIRKLIKLFTKEKELVLDPFSGSGTTLLACALEKRQCIGIDMNKKYNALAKKRLKQAKAKKQKLVHGNALKKIKELPSIDYCVTSPPYHDILKNNGQGLRHDNSQKRQGIEYYSNNPDDVGNQKTYQKYLATLQNIMKEVYAKLKKGKYCTVIVSDFTVNKKETNAHGDIISLMSEIGFDFQGNTILLQNSKPLYPFGYPYAFKINHVHQYLLHFRKGD